MPAHNVEITGTFEVNQYTATFVLDNGEANVVLTQNYGTAITAPEPTKSEYRFAGWNVEVPATMPAENKTFTAQWTKIVAHVTSANEMKAAIADTNIEKIILDDSFTAPSTIVVGREVEIDGNGKTITAASTGFERNYVLQAYDTTGVKVKNISLTGANAGLLVNGSNVTLEGTVNVSGNNWGGIEVSTGSSLAGKASNLTIAEGVTLTNTTEEYTKPTVWIDGTDTNPNLTVTGGAFAVNTAVKAGQRQYYLTAENATTAHITNLEEFNQALAKADIQTIILDDDIEIDTNGLDWTNISNKKSIEVTRPVTIDGAGHKLSFTERPTYTSGGNNYVMKVYNTTGVTIKDIAFTNSLGGLLVSSSNVTLEGQIDVTGNTWGGIEVSKSSNDGLSASTLNVNGTIKIDDEALNRPAVWIDKNLTENTVNYTGHTSQQMSETQIFYFANTESMTKAYIDSEAALTAALADESIGKITLAGDITGNVVIPSERELTIDLNGKTLSISQAITNNGDLTISDEDSNGNIVSTDDHTLINNGTLTVNGGNYDTKKHAKATLVNNSTAIINDGKFFRSDEAGVDGSNNGGNSYYTIDNTGKMLINGGTFENSGHFSSMFRNINKTNTDNNGILVIKDGTFEGGLNTVKNDEHATLYIENGTFKGFTQCCIQNWNKTYILGGTFNAPESGSTVMNTIYASDGTGELFISGGKFIAGTTGKIINAFTNSKYYDDIHAGKVYLLKENGTFSFYAEDGETMINVDSIIASDIISKGDANKDVSSTLDTTTYETVVTVPEI